VPLSGGGIVPGVPGGTGVVNPATSVVSINPPFVPVAGGVANLVVTARDVNNLPVVGATVIVVPARGGTDTVTPIIPTTDGSGTATFQVRSTLPGPATFTVTVNGVPLAAPATVTFQ
jgi:hypothetical protein